MQQGLRPVASWLRATAAQRSSRLSLGLVGLPNVGKSTLFNALTRTQLAQAGNYPFCTIDPNRALVQVADATIDRLAALQGRDNKRVYTQAEFVDIAGLVRGASKGAGLGNQFLATIRQCSGLINVVRCFGGASSGKSSSSSRNAGAGNSEPEDDKYSTIEHVDGSVDPVRNAETIRLELQLADLELLERTRERRSRKAKAGPSADVKADMDLLDALSKRIDQGGMAYDHLVSERDFSFLAKEVGLLTAKPAMYVCNVGEEDIANGNAHTRALSQWVVEHAPICGEDDVDKGFDFVPVFNVCAQLEAEMAEVTATDGGSSLEDMAELREMLAVVGLEQSSLDTVAIYARKLLGVQQFYTTGDIETRAWAIPFGATARDAAAVIHSDLGKNFVRAEVCSAKTMIDSGTSVLADLKAIANAVRVEGPNYVVQPDDVLLVRASA